MPERLFWWRAGVLAVHTGGFYLLSAALGLPQLAALGIMAGASILVLVCALKCRTSMDWLELLVNGVFGGLFVCGVVPFVVTDDREEPGGSDIAVLIFLASSAEAAFYLSALGVFGVTVALPIMAVVIAVLVFAAQLLTLAISIERAKFRRASSK